MSRVSKTFTVEEANRTLPLVKHIVEDILRSGRRLRLRSAAENPGPDDLRKIEGDKRRLRDLFRELEDLGCSYKDWSFEKGLVDFPALIDNEPVLLCWRSDEPEITHYHGINDGYQGRRLIPRTLQPLAEGGADGHVVNAE